MLGSFRSKGMGKPSDFSAPVSPFSSIARSLHVALLTQSPFAGYHYITSSNSHDQPDKQQKMTESLRRNNSYQCQDFAFFRSEVLPCEPALRSALGTGHNKRLWRLVFELVTSPGQQNQKQRPRNFTLPTSTFRSLGCCSLRQKKE